MRPFAKRILAAGVLVIAVTAMLSGCVVCVDDVFGNNSQPRSATLHVYARDYFSGAPIPWARVELYESDWWSWDYEGTWRVNQSGYVRLPCGYLTGDGCGGNSEEVYRVVVYAEGYHAEDYEIELSYYYPSETLTFYLMPYAAREAGSAGSRSEDDIAIHEIESESGEARQSGGGKVLVGDHEEALE
jgi:hypothetical protein